jgi:hypothetical protein
LLFVQVDRRDPMGGEIGAQKKAGGEAGLKRWGIEPYETTGPVRSSPGGLGG